uniref:Uncharacterized protein n=2 Tax=Vibrio TaxID=662 RepID=A0A0H3ZRY8_9VIBR|nr:hypothetical protein [Vibrio tasmaniensis]AKN37137.1 hypothetical protein [Vibrio genomosp. F6]
MSTAQIRHSNAEALPVSQVRMFNLIDLINNHYSVTVPLF